VKDSIIIHDVGPRDGLQNQPKILTPGERLQIVRALLAAGVDHIQVAAFVSPVAVPAMAGAAEIVAGLAGERGKFSVLIPNMKGYELALAAGSRTMEMVLYGTDGMAQANVRMSRGEAEDVTAEILARARQDDVAIVATISVSFECPFDGKVDPLVVTDMTDKFMDLGAEVVVIADTIGAADPAQVNSMMAGLVRKHGADRLGCHFHDTRALGLANVYAATEAGVRRFDASVAGVGGCPFAPGASGNVATEDVVMMLEHMGFDTGIDLRALMDASALVAELTGNAPGGRARPWLKRHLEQTVQSG
jgi:hydroxymethylglutaryl-CoA lyase